MPQEIERKFLVANDGWREGADKGRRLRQAYLATTDRAAVRVRIEEDVEAVLTVKSANPGLTRIEFEYKLPLDDAETLATLRQGSELRKTRFRNRHAGHDWEIDVYAGDNDGSRYRGGGDRKRGYRGGASALGRPRGHRRAPLLRLAPRAGAFSRLAGGEGLTMAWRFEPGEDLQQAFRRVAEEEVERARAGLADGQADRARAIHAARQCFKRLRALARLARPALRRRFATESHRWRDAGRLLSGSRDRTVLMQTFDKIVAECGFELPAATVQTLKKRLLKDALDPTPEETEARVGETLALLDAASRDMASLEWPRDSQALALGCHRSQAQLKKTWKSACEQGSAEALHTWRKRVKDLSAQTRLFRRVMPEAIKAIRDEAKATAEHLGEEHDLWLLSERLAGIAAPVRLAKARDRLLKVIGDRRAVLQRQAFERGERFSSRSPKAFARAMADGWDDAWTQTKKNPRRKKAREAGSPPQAAPTSQAG